jgi:hypothetical protein
VTSGNDILMGSGAPTAKFPTVGTTVTGTVLREPEARQAKEYRTGVLETWKDGSPKMIVVVQLATSERDPAIPSDDGTRALYIEGKHLTDAVRKAVRAAGANGIHTGGTLTVQYIADGPAESGLNPPKLYAAQYTPPAVSWSGVGAPGNAPTSPAPAGYPQAPAPTYQPAPQPAGYQQPPAAATASVLGAPAGVDPQVWARLDPGQRERVVAAMGAPIPAGQQPGY